MCAEEGEVEAQSSDIPPAPSFGDLLDFLNEKAPHHACLICKSKELELARERRVNGKRFRPAITLVGPHGPFQEYSFYTSCSNCGAVQMFDLRPFRRWKQKRDDQGKGQV
jgi:hypothetical protein